jgi:hypothetical protein
MAIFLQKKCQKFLPSLLKTRRYYIINRNFNFYAFHFFAYILRDLIENLKIKKSKKLYSFSRLYVYPQTEVTLFDEKLFEPFFKKT